MVDLDLPIDPDPAHFAASLEAELTTALQQRPELAEAAGVYAVSYAGANFGSQDELPTDDVELDETSRIVIWARRQALKKVARQVSQVVEVPKSKELVRASKRARLSDAGSVTWGSTKA